MKKEIFRTAVVAALCVWHTTATLAETETIFFDEFDFFEIGEFWGTTDAGQPDVLFEAVNGVLRMSSSALFADDFLGIQMFDAIPVTGLSNITVDTRLQPINAGVEGAVAAAEVALLGTSGEIIRAFASNNAGPDPESANDWADHYLDSKENAATSGPWPHCDLACDAPRNFVLTIDNNGTTFQSFDDDDPLDTPTYEARFDNFTLSDFGGGFVIALRQQALENGDDAVGHFDSVYVTTDTSVGISGDFDGDGDHDTADVDSLVVQIAGNTNNLAFDLNGDSAIDTSDLQAWLTEAGSVLGFSGPVLPGDANLDGTVNAGDLNALGVNWQAAIAAWSGGDFNADGTIDAADLNVLGVNWQGSVAAAPASVPEPSSCLLLILGGLAVLGRQRRFATTRRGIPG